MNGPVGCEVRNNGQRNATAAGASRGAATHEFSEIFMHQQLQPDRVSPAVLLTVVAAGMRTATGPESAARTRASSACRHATFSAAAACAAAACRAPPCFQPACCPLPPAYPTPRPTAAAERLLGAALELREAASAFDTGAGRCVNPWLEGSWEAACWPGGLLWGYAGVAGL